MSLRERLSTYRCPFKHLFSMIEQDLGTVGTLHLTRYERIGVLLRMLN